MQGDATPTFTSHITGNAGNTLTATNFGSYLKMDWHIVTSPQYNTFNGIANYTILNGDFVEYDIQWTATNQKTAIDFGTVDAAEYRDSGTLDQLGFSCHPNTDLLLAPVNVWYHRKMSLALMNTGSAIGKVINFNDFATDGLTGDWTVYLRNFAITDGAGTGTARFKDLGKPLRPATFTPGNAR